MIINFNIAKLNTLLLDFYKITGLTISIWDSNFNQLSYQPNDMSTFCRMIKNTKLGNKRCFENDKKLCRLSMTTNEAQTHRCHAGLIDTAIPIKFKDSVLGYMMFGQATDEESDEKFEEQIKKLSAELKLDEDDLRDAHSKLKKYQPEIIKSAANILKMATRYLWLADMIKINNDDLATKIDEYVRANVEKKITVDLLCREFNISKNKLYALSKSHLKTTIGNYVQNIRLDTAKNLLATTDLPIYQICAAVGMDEYNYFTKIFKKEVGVTPTQYRKQFPLSLHQ